MFPLRIRQFFTRKTPIFHHQTITVYGMWFCMYIYIRMYAACTYVHMYVRKYVCT